MKGAVLVHLASGVGNIVFSTPLLVALGELQFAVDVLVSADYPQTIELLRPWSLVRNVVGRADGAPYEHLLPAVPPFCWSRFQRSYQGLAKVVRRPPDALFYENEQEFYLAFARQIGFPSGRKPCYCLPITPGEQHEVGSRTLVMAPGCKAGEMALKRWPWFAELAARFEDVVAVGTSNDLRDAEGNALRFPPHVRSLVDQLTLRETAEAMAAAGAVVGNDSGLSHVAGALGTPTLILFGPTPDKTLGPLPANVRVMRAGLDCEPCWFGRKFAQCDKRIDCLRQLPVERVEEVLLEMMGLEKVKPRLPFLPS